MGKFSAFDIIGPRMIGPSSSHTAGAAKIALFAYKLAKGDIVEATITLFGSFAETGRGHGTDKALVAGLLGMESDDKRLRFSLLLAQETGMKIQFRYSDEERDHPNTVSIRTTSSTGEITEIEGQSIGGGNVQLTKINGMSVRITGEYPALVLLYEDAPGVISKVTDILAEYDINIAFMRVFRTAKREDACMVIETDTQVTDNAVEHINEAIERVHEVRTIC